LGAFPCEDGRMETQINEAHARLVMDMIRPQIGSGTSSADGLPEFALQSAAWRESFEFAEKIGVLAPFLARVEAAPWFGELGERIRLEAGQRLSRERMLLAVVDQELDASLSSLIGAHIPAV